MTLPNQISLFRLLLVPLTIWLMLEGDFVAALAVFCTAGISDAIDGFIARRFHLRSPLGAILDPLADKVLLVSVYITFGVIGVLPAWIVILVVARDLMILGGYLLLHVMGEPPEVRPLAISKINTVAQIVLAAALLLRLGFHAELRGEQDLLVFCVAVTASVSGAAYIVQWLRLVGHKGTRQ